MPHRPASDLDHQQQDDDLAVVDPVAQRQQTDHSQRDADLGDGGHQPRKGGRHAQIPRDVAQNRLAVVIIGHADGAGDADKGKDSVAQPSGGGRGRVVRPSRDCRGCGCHAAAPNFIGVTSGV